MEPREKTSNLNDSHETDLGKNLNAQLIHGCFATKDVFML